MRTKEEILDDIDKEEITVYYHWVEVLIDIRDILKDAFYEEVALAEGDRKRGIK